MTWKYGRQTPDTNLMRFVARRFSEPAKMLDIGSGEGANARELRSRGHDVLTIDKNETNADIWEDICSWDPVTASFNLIYDVNTLCHVENPPFEKIKSWLKPRGIFFSICPTERCWRGVADGKEFTRFATHSDLRSMLSIFASYEIYGALCPDFRGNELESWIAEARP